MTNLVDLPTDQLIGCYWNRRRRANEAESEMYALRDEADEISGMLTARGWRQNAHEEWVKER